MKIIHIFVAVLILSASCFAQGIDPKTTERIGSLSSGCIHVKAGRHQGRAVQLIWRSQCGKSKIGNRKRITVEKIVQTGNVKAFDDFRMVAVYPPSN